MLKFDLILPWERDKTGLIPIVLKFGTVNDELAVQPNRDFLADHADEKCVPFTGGIVREDKR